jgi:hypothetical protein
MFGALSTFNTIALCVSRISSTSHRRSEEATTAAFGSGLKKFRKKSRVMAQMTVLYIQL